MDALRHYRQMWAVDFEFGAGVGERPTPLCVVARELRSGELARCWLADGAAAAPPYPIGPDSLIVAYYASAELGCHLALDWPMLVRVLDLYAEFRNRTSGLTVLCGYGLLGAMAYFGLDCLEAAEKEAMRSLALRGGPYTDAEKMALLDYCQSDVDALTKLLPAMIVLHELVTAVLKVRMTKTGFDEVAKLRQPRGVRWLSKNAAIIALVISVIALLVGIAGFLQRFFF